MLFYQQQRRFPENYEDRGYLFDEDKGYLIDPETGEIAKGVLKGVLRGEIDAQIKSEGFLYESVDEAVAVYEQEHGVSDPEIMQLIVEKLRDYQWWVKKFGWNDLIQLGLKEKGFPESFYEFALPQGKEVFGEGFSEYWPGFVRIGLATEKDIRSFFRWAFPGSKKFLR